MPTSVQYTPKHYVDIDFDWVTNELIVTSRMEEGEQTNEPGKQPLPLLYSIDIENNKQVAITNPPKGYGDYNPQYVKSMEKLVWLRGTSIIDNARTLWKSNPDGSGTEAWIKNVDTVEFY